MYDLVREASLSKVANQENNARKKCKCKSDVILTGTLSKDVYIPRIYADVHCFATQKTIHVWFEWKKSPPCWWMCKMFFFLKKRKTTISCLSFLNTICIVSPHKRHLKKYDTVDMRKKWKLTLSLDHITMRKGSICFNLFAPQKKKDN